MASDKAPAYQMYARDWLGSRSVRLMADFQRGWYIQLLNEAWDSDPQGMLPNDPEMLMGLAGVTEARRSEPGFNRRWTAVMDRFIVSGDWIYNEKQFSQVAAIEEYRRKQSEKGSLSAKKRAARKAEMDLLLQKANSGSTAVEPWLDRGSTGRSTGSQPEVNPPTPTPTPPAFPPSAPPPPPSGEPSAGAEDVCVSPVSSSSLFPEEESLSSGERAVGKKKSAAAEKPDPWGWDEFAAVYPAFRLKPDVAAKNWFRRNLGIGPGRGDKLDAILASVAAWLKSEQWIQGKVPNCSKFLDEGIWQVPAGPPPRSGVRERQDDNREAMRGAARILGFDPDGGDDGAV